MQQGRVQLDADWNEQAEIQAYLERTEATDVIGRSGAPKQGGNFAIGVTSGRADLTIAPGRFYVEGVLCELETEEYTVASFPSSTQATLAEWPDDDARLQKDAWVELAADGIPSALNRIKSANKGSATVTLVDDAAAFTGAANARLRTVTTYLGQPDLPDPPAFTAVPAAGRRDLVYLDVWEREVSATEDPELLEPALGGVDTATRVRTVWQVRVREGVSATTCAELDEIGPAPGDGVLTAAEAPPAADPGPCLVPPGAGYRGLENRLYRVEIHGANGTGPTYKWARDNGASAFAIEEFVNEDATGTDRIRVKRLGRDQVLALAEQQFVEVLDDDDVLLGRPGTFVQITDIDEEERILTLSAKVQGYSVARRARARRWDGGPIGVAPGTAQELEDGIELTFGGSGFATGDYWLFAARTATGEIEALEEAPPDGIRHRYAPLALLTWDGGGAAVAVEDCRALFPPLTAIEAEDVAFDNAACGLVTTAGEPADTVQEALDVLCESHSLRHHNSHLHGWGIVTGLKVVCDPEDRTRVVVRPGWAIDRAGNDIRIDETNLPFMDLVREHDQDPANPTDILDANGVGDAWLFWSPSRGSGADRFGVEPYSSDWKQELNDRLLETLLMEFYEDSIKDVQAFFERELKAPPGSEDDPVSPAHEKVAALSNLFAQRLSPQSGQHILVTPREHELLKRFYEGLREELSLETFCGLFDDARPYPGTYPNAITGIDTIFGRGQHQRLKLRPGGNEAYSVGPGVSPAKAATTINRWDLKAGKLVAQINPIASQTGTDVRRRGLLRGSAADTGVGAVSDIAFSPDGKRIYMVAPTRNGEDTMFRVGTIGAKDIDWGDVFTICDLKVVALATTAADPTKIYAVAQKRGADKKLLGDGIYRIDPDTLAAGTQPVRVGDAFNAVGHFRLAPNGEAWATEAPAGQAPTKYTAVRRIADVTGRAAATATVVPLSGMSGKDDIAVFRNEDGAPADTLYAVAETSTGTKFVLGFRGTTEIARIPLESTALRLEVYPPTNALLVTSEDGFCVRVIDLKAHAKVQHFVPMQLGPIAIASDPARDRVLVLNYLSSSLTVATGKLFAPTAKFPAAQLAAYRQAAVNAYNDLLARFLEYLKDCLCEHLLVANPDTSAETKLYLGAVSIRRPRAPAEGESRVYKVCNLSRRRYVKSFPAVGHWLSLVPVLPFLDLLVELFCCWVMPDTFGRYAAADYDESKSLDPQFPFRLGRAREGADTLQAFEALGTVAGLFGKFLQFGKVATDS
jgi:hypothetical protein